MDDKKECKIAACCKSNCCGIIGMILVVLATILTLITLNGAGILGMFVAGLVFCCHKHMSSKGCCPGCRCGCCSSEDTMVCSLGDKDKPAVEKRQRLKNKTS